MIENERTTNAFSEKPNRSNESKFSLGTVIVAGLMGFLGGFIAIRLTPGALEPTTSITEQIVTSEGEVIADLAERVSPSVVSINVTTEDSRFSSFFGEQTFEGQAEGTGIILTEDGLVVTNKHVIPEEATEVSVVLNDGTVYEDVEVIGREPFNDLAYLQIQDVSDLTPAVLGDSDEIRVGSRTIAIGNALGEFDTTVTSGIISGQGRPIVAGFGSDSEQLSNLFQTDASINQGNSGGPLLNIKGEVIGINTAVAGDAENIGFAIPINDVKPGIASVKKNGELIRPYLGVRYISLSPELAEELELSVEQGAYLYSGVDGDSEPILSDSPAEKAGLQEDDIILKVNDEELTEERLLPNVVSKYQVDETITLEVLRGEETIQIEVVLERVPEDL